MKGIARPRCRKRAGEFARDRERRALPRVVCAVASARELGGILRVAGSARSPVRAWSTARTDR